MEDQALAILRRLDETLAGALRKGVPPAGLRETFVAAVPFATMPRVTASFGVAELLPGEQRDALIGRADQALYRAKDSGRDRVECA